MTETRRNAGAAGQTCHTPSGRKFGAERCIIRIECLEAEIGCFVAKNCPVQFLCWCHPLEKFLYFVNVFMSLTKTTVAVSHLPRYPSATYGRGVPSVCFVFFFAKSSSLPHPLSACLSWGRLETPPPPWLRRGDWRRCRRLTRRLSCASRVPASLLADDQFPTSGSAECNLQYEFRRWLPCLMFLAGPTCSPSCNCKRRPARERRWTARLSLSLQRPPIRQAKPLVPCGGIRELPSITARRGRLGLFQAHSTREKSGARRGEPGHTQQTESCSMLLPLLFLSSDEIRVVGSAHFARNITRYNTDGESVALLPCTPRNACELARASAAGAAKDNQPSRLNPASLLRLGRQPRIIREVMHTHPHAHPLCPDPVVGWPVPLPTRPGVEHAVQLLAPRWSDLQEQPDAWSRGQGRWGPVPRSCTHPNLPAASYAPPAARFRRVSALRRPIMLVACMSEPRLTRQKATTTRVRHAHEPGRLAAQEGLAHASPPPPKHLPKHCPILAAAPLPGVLLGLVLGTLSKSISHESPRRDDADSDAGSHRSSTAACAAGRVRLRVIARARPLGAVWGMSVAVCGRGRGRRVARVPRGRGGQGHAGGLGVPRHFGHVRRGGAGSPGNLAPTELAAFALLIMPPVRRGGARGRPSSGGSRATEAGSALHYGCCPHLDRGARVYEHQGQPY